MDKIRIGTRGSRLALWQAEFIEQELRQHHPNVEFEKVIIKTEGDRDQKSSLTRIGGMGVFTKSIEDALLRRRIDIAVHSLKDLPSAMSPGLELGAVPERGFVEDALVTADGCAVQELGHAAVVATGSIRRRSQLLNTRPDLVIRDLRGNIDTRLRKLSDQGLDGIVMARAAIARLQLNEVRYYTFPTEIMTPGVGQGAIGVQLRSGDQAVCQLTETLNHRPSFLAVSAERAFLRELDSGCQFPVGAFAIIANEQITLTGFVGSENGKTVIRDQISGRTDAPDGVGVSLARKFVDKGARDILDGNH
jgi:hydroxymethylbilane synthase